MFPDRPSGPHFADLFGQVWVGTNCNSHAQLLDAALFSLLVDPSLTRNLTHNWGFPSRGGTPKWMVDKGKSESKMDDDWGYP